MSNKAILETAKKTFSSMESRRKSHNSEMQVGISFRWPYFRILRRNFKQGWSQKFDIEVSKSEIQNFQTNTTLMKISQLTTTFVGYAFSYSKHLRLITSLLILMNTLFSIYAIKLSLNHWSTIWLHSQFLTIIITENTLSTIAVTIGIINVNVTSLQTNGYTSIF